MARFIGSVLFDLPFHVFSHLYDVVYIDNPPLRLLFFIVYVVSDLKKVIEQFKLVHELARTGRSVESAIKLANSDRKTLGRFKHIYYLYIQNRSRLKQVSGKEFYNII